MTDQIVDIIVSILTGLAAAIPLVVALVKFIQQSVKGKKWDELLGLVIDLMEVAETKFETGADRKEWVLMMIKASADNIEYPVDLEQISKLIDALCNMSKVVNSSAETKVVSKK